MRLAGTTSQRRAPRPVKSIENERSACSRSSAALIDTAPVALGFAEMADEHGRHRGLQAVPTVDNSVHRGPCSAPQTSPKLALATPDLLLQWLPTSKHRPTGKANPGTRTPDHSLLCQTASGVHELYQSDRHQRAGTALWRRAWCIARSCRRSHRSPAWARTRPRRCRPPPRVAFTIAAISLGAKMARADGDITRDEVDAFNEVFRITSG
jgi:hypothetical protein